MSKHTHKKAAPNWERTFYVFNFNVCDGRHDGVRDEGQEGKVLGQARHDDGDDHNAKASGRLPSDYYYVEWDSVNRCIVPR